MKDLGLINYEGNCLTAVHQNGNILIKDQYGIIVTILNIEGLNLFLKGEIDIKDSKGKSWNYLNESEEARAKKENIEKFLGSKKIESALISVYDKDFSDEIVRHLASNDVTIYSTGGTAKFIKDLGINCVEVEDLTSFPEILGGRVKTLHPKIFGGILSRSENKNDVKELKKHNIPKIDLVIVDLYPFEETVEQFLNEISTFEDVVEKIDIGGVALIRAAAKNFSDVVVLCTKKEKQWFLDNEIKETNKLDRKRLAAVAFKKTKKYDKQIYRWLENF